MKKQSKRKVFIKIILNFFQVLFIPAKINKKIRIEVEMKKYKNTSCAGLLVFLRHLFTLSTSLFLAQRAFFDNLN